MGVYDELLKRNSAIDAVTGGFQAPQGSIPTLALRQMALSKVNDDRNFRLNESAVTERYMPQEAEDMVRKLADLKNRYASSDIAGQRDIVNQSKGLRNDWTMRGLDPNAIQSGISSDEMFKRVGQMGKTPQGLQRAFDNKMDTDKYKRGIFENDRGFKRGVLESDRDYAIRRASEARQAENMRIDNARQASGGSGGGKPPSFTNLMTVWKATGTAPKGLESVGIQPGTAYTQGKDGKPPNYDETPEWASEISEINSGDTSYDFILNNSQSYIGQYGYDGYSKLLSAAKSRMDD